MSGYLLKRRRGCEFVVRKAKYKFQTEKIGGNTKNNNFQFSIFGEGSPKRKAGPGACIVL